MSQNTGKTQGQEFALQIAAAVKREREAAQMSQEELGESAFGYTGANARTYVSRLERTGRGISISSVEKIAKALGIAEWELLR